jgi:hypothetical protein
MPSIADAKVPREETGNRHGTGCKKPHRIRLLCRIGLGEIRIRRDKPGHVELLSDR